MNKRLTRLVTETIILASLPSYFLARINILAGIFFGLTTSRNRGTLLHGFHRFEGSDKLFAPAHTFSQRPTLMRDRSKLERQSRSTRATPHAVLFTYGVGQPGGPDIVRRAEAPSWATLPCLPSGRDTAASYLEQSRQRRNPDDRVGMAERLSVVTADRVG